MPRNINQIMTELDQFFAPSAKVIKKQRAALPGQFAGAREGLIQRKDNEFRDIGKRANRKGLAFSGLPIEEEARFTGEQFLPGLANLKSQEQQASLSLAQALAGLRKEQGNIAVGIRENEISREEAARQAAAARAASARAAAAAAAPNPLAGLIETLTGGGSTGGSGQTKASQLNLKREADSAAAAYAANFKASNFSPEQKQKIFQSIVGGFNKTGSYASLAKAKEISAIMGWGWSPQDSIKTPSGFSRTQRKDGNEFVITNSPRY